MNCFQLVKTVLDELYARIPGESDAAKDKLINHHLNALSDAYAQLLRRNTVDHANVVTRFAYIYRYVTAHANYVYQMLLKSEPLQALFTLERIHITCVGGGPGSDFLGVLKYVQHAGKTPSLKCILYDRENAWGESWLDVDDKLDETDLRINTTFQQFDVTQQSSWENSTKYLMSDLFSMVYFLSEVYSVKAEAEPFFINMFYNAKPGALFLFIDNNSPAFYEWFDEMVACSPVDVLDRFHGRMVISDYSEQKHDLGEYREKFENPKLQADVAYRVCRRR